MSVSPSAPPSWQRLPALPVDWRDAAPAAGESRAVSGGSLLALLLIATLLLGLAWRLYLLQRFYLIPDADQTITGLMARHIAHGERPVFYWGQPYTGSGEAYITALLFGAFGQSDWLLHTPPMAASLAFIALTVTLAWRLYGAGVAALCALFLGAAPSLLIDWSLWAGSGYLEAMALGTAAMLLALPEHPQRPARVWKRLPAAFFLLGLAVWVQPIAAYYALAVLAMLMGSVRTALAAPRRWPSAVALALCCLACGALGMTPLLAFNVQHGGATLGFLTDRATHLGIATVTSRALLWSGPVMLGLMPPTTDEAYFARFALDHWALYGVALFLTLALLSRCLLLWRTIGQRLRALIARDPPRDAGLIVLSILVVAGFVTSSWGAEAWSASQPRYLLPLYSAVPLAARALLPRRPRTWHWFVAWLLALGVAGGGIYVSRTNFGRTDPRPLATLLLARGVTAVYGDYWTIYPLIYASNEQLSGAAVNDDLSEGRNRYSPYLRAAAAGTHFAWVVQAGSARQRSVLLCLAHLHSVYATVYWRDQVIYDHPSNRAFPWWNGGRCPTV